MAILAVNPTLGGAQMVVTGLPSTVWGNDTVRALGYPRRFPATDCSANPAATSPFVPPGRVTTVVSVSVLSAIWVHERMIGPHATPIFAFLGEL